jgi:hypothetical protein
MKNRMFRPEFAWPAAVVLLLLAGAGSAFAVLFFARSDGGAEVVADYYRRGLAWDSTAAVERSVGRFGWTVSVEPAAEADGTGMRAVRVWIADSAGSPVSGLAIEVEASRPHLATPAGRAAASPHLQPGAYVAWLPVRETGLWDFTVHGSRDGDPFALRLRREILR